MVDTTHRRPAASAKWAANLLALFAGATILACAVADESATPGRAPGVLDEIVIVASKTPRPLYAVPARVTTFSADRLAFEQVQSFDEIARYESALEAEFNTPRFGAGGISIRGIGGNRVALEIDGVPLPQEYAVGNFADSSRLALDPAIIEHIEILRGPASTLYGSDAIGGVVTIATVDGADLVGVGREQHAGVRVGYFGDSETGYGAATHAWSSARDSTVATIGYRNGSEPDNKARRVPDDRIDFEQWQGFGKWTHEFDSGAVLRLSFDYFERDTDSDIESLLGFGRFAASSSLLGVDEQRRDRETLAVDLPVVRFFDAVSLMVYRQDASTRQRTDERRVSGVTPVILQRDFELRELAYGGELRMRAAVATGALAHVVVFGAEWDHQRLTERRDGRQIDLASGRSTRAILGEQFPVRDLPHSVTDEVGVYIQDEISYGPVTVVAGLRWDDFSLDAKSDDVVSDLTRITDLEADKVTARAGVALRLATALQLYTHYTEGFRAPSPGEVNLLLDIPLFNIRAVPNPDLRPERSVTVEAGLRWGYGRTRFETAVYHSDYDDFIESRVNLGPDPLTGVLIFQSRNLAQAHIYGIEAELTQGLGIFHTALDELVLEAGFHVARGENDVSGRPLNDVNPLKAVFALRWEPTHSPFTTALRVSHLGEKDRVDLSLTPLFVPPAATFVDVTTRWLPHPALTLELGVYNLGDERYWRYADVRQFDPTDPRVEIASRPGRAVRLTLSLRY